VQGIGNGGDTTANKQQIARGNQKNTLLLRHIYIGISQIPTLHIASFYGITIYLATRKEEDGG